MAKRKKTTPKDPALDRNDQEAKKIANMSEAQPTEERADKPAPPVGVVSITLETPQGKKVKASYRIHPGYPRVRMGREILNTAELMRAANGEKVKGISQEHALELLEEAAALGAGWLQKID